MTLWTLLAEQPAYFLTLATLLGLLVGSFLNVLVYRLPIMLERQWQREAQEVLGLPVTQHERFDLCLPASRCPHCAHQIRAWENIPVISYLALRGHCSACKTRISPRYPMVEIASALLSLVVAWRFGASVEALLALPLTWCLLALSLIDAEHQLLPDVLVLPMLWLGLIVNAFNLYAPLTDALWGAVAGYLSLWTVYWVFKLATGKEGMGYGDFKLFAALGAWFGWQALIPMILMASVIGAVIGIAMKFSSGLREGGYIPFGPFLAFAGLAALIVGPGQLLTWVGL